MTIFDKVMLSGDFDLIMEFNQLTLDCLQQYQDDQWEELRLKSNKVNFR